jgi:2-keto-4-pentenoate hydratase/2-oxohepta-3-ene-1,7-dioic acid hydratase in catechol pathway
MKLCRFQPLAFPAKDVEKGEARLAPAALCGIIHGDTVREIAGDLFGARTETGRAWPLAQVRLLAPVIPGKIICIGRNYREHAVELNNPVPAMPMLFFKPPSSVIGPDDLIVMPAESQRVDYEGELALVVGRECCKGAGSEDFLPYLLGSSCLNDVTARDIQKLEQQFNRAKSFDTFCPLGPVIETDANFADMTVETFVNGARRQSGRVADMIFPLGFLFRWISQIMTLLPGDVIATGTPSGVGNLHANDVVEVIVSGVGTLRNRTVGASQ